MSNNKKLQNQLYKESSPYLLQHANNPVNWFAWNEEALSLARSSNKPILLSIGYSACHWCHVMAHESFEDQTTADVMNDLFINIKVDKEERPDLDKIYQNAHSLLTERAGGWPLTVFLTPNDHMPIFAGTYFPKTSKHNLPAFVELLKHISDIWKTRESDIQQQSNSLHTAYQRIYESTKPEQTTFNHALIDIARTQIEQQFDSQHGGFSPAPKFPHPAIIDFALRHWCHTKKCNRPDPRILHSAIFSLEKMAEGGIFDHLAGGFCRYSTDEQWMIPHFEKMLYDNGPLLSLYSQAWKINANPLFHDACCETANWVLREMQSSDGGYYAAQDADSEGSEGKFFVWSQKEINTLLNQASELDNVDTESIEYFKTRFGLDRDENFEGLWHLHGYISEATIAKQHNLDETRLHNQLHLIRQYLFQQREKRIHPETDTKVLCGWNGLMIHAMSMTGRLLNKPDYIESARNAAYFLRNDCWKNGKLFASTKDGKASLSAYLDDYAFLIYGILELLQSRWDNTLYQWILELADTLLAEFEDTEYGGFYFTGHNHEDLIQRLKTFSDDAIPSGNAIAALTLNRLGYLTGEQRYIDAAEQCLQSAWRSIANNPISHCALLSALNEYLTPPDIVIIRSHDTADSTSDEKNQEDNTHWNKLTELYHLPTTLIYDIPANQKTHSTLAEKTAGNANRAYICTGFQCQSPIENTADFEQYLRNNSYRILE